MNDTPQVSNAPEPIAQMQQVSNDWGNNLAAGSIKSLDDFINGMIERAGDLVGAGVTKAAGAVASAGAAIGAGASKAAAPFKESFSPTATQMSPESPSQGHGLGRERAIEAKPSMEASLGSLSPASTPSMGQSQSQGHSM